MRFGPRIIEQADTLAAFSDSPGAITRTYLSASHRKAADYLLALMREAGMTASIDALGNIVGRYEGLKPDAKTIITGSHQDSVVDAGRYDGLFGILSPIACVASLSQRGKRLPYAIEVIGFGDEEGVRFDVTMIGSAAMAGRFDEKWLAKTDAQGITMAQALVEFGCDPTAWATIARQPEQIACFVESHIEQGPVLLDGGLPVGVVTAIAGVTRVRATVSGIAGHAGTVPMSLRHDALTAAAAMALEVERLTLADAGSLVGTVGKFAVAAGGAINVIPGRVQFTVDLRSGDDTARLKAAAELKSRCEQIARERGVTLDWDAFFELGAAPCDAALQDQLARAIAKRDLAVRRLPSGAGHDAMKFSGVVPIAMLFVRCGNGGISHNPLETMTVKDADLSTEVLLDFFENFSA